MKQVGWERRLIDHMQSTADDQLTDCALALADMVQTINGEDHAAPFRGKYETIPQGYKLLRKAGFADHVDYIASIFEELPSVLHAQRGDIAVIEGDDGIDALGLVQGENIYVLAPTSRGIVRLETAKRAFRV